MHPKHILILKGAFEQHTSPRRLFEVKKIAKNHHNLDKIEQNRSDPDMVGAFWPCAYTHHLLYVFVICMSQAPFHYILESL